MAIKIEHSEKLTVHHLHKGMHPLHKDYGFWICSTGGCSSAPLPELPTRYFEFYSLSHMYDGSGQFTDNKKRTYTISPGQGILISPNYIHSYGAAAKNYIEDSICFYGPVADTFYKYGIISDGIIEIGKARRLLPIIKMASDPAVDAQLNANLALQKLLLDIYHENRKKSKPEKYENLKQLLSMIREDTQKWWSIEEMAEFCNLSTAQFRRVFKRHTGMLPKDYIDRLKILKAAELLIGTNYSVEEIAGMFGYRDPFHFSKRFKQITGFAPLHYRTEFVLNNSISR